MKKYALFALVWGENIFHCVVGHKVSWILCGEGRKYEPLKLFKWFAHCLGLGARLYLFQHNQTEQGPKPYIDGGMICEGSLGQIWSQTERGHEIIVADQLIEGSKDFLAAASCSSYSIVRLKPG